MIGESTFRAGTLLSNRHLQTILPRVYKYPQEQYYSEEFILSDDDFIDLVWTSIPEENTTTPIVIVLHGLEASLDSPYIQHMLYAITQHGWHGVLMHFRGCSGRPNRLARAYHSGDTKDLNEVIQHIKQRCPSAPRYLVGFSVGGNVALKYAGEQADALGVESLVSICPPVLLDACANAIDRGFSKYYQRRLLKSLKAKVLQKWVNHNYNELLGITREQVLACKTFWQFDDLFTAPMHGFNGVHDYYDKSSSYHYVLDITKPALLIHTMDDPFMPGNIIDGQFDASHSVVTELSQHGGHLGFIGGSIFKPEFWLAGRVCKYLEEFIN